MINFKDLPIRTKLISFIMISALLSVFILSSVFIFQRYHSFKQQITDEFSAIAQIIADRSNAAILFEDKRALTEILASLTLHPQVSLACTFNSEDQLLAEYSKVTAAEAGTTTTRHCPETAGEPRHYFDANYFYIGEPIKVNGENSGMVFIQASTAKLTQEVVTTSVSALALSSLVIFLAFIFARYIQRFITNPLLELQQATGNVSLDIEKMPEVKKHNNDEVGALVDAFNTMIHTIAEQNKIILAHTDNLEQEVSERTKELAMANRELEAFSYSVSHDLKAPLRTIEGFSLALEEDYGHQLDSTALHYLNRVRAGSAKMTQLISNLLQLSRVTRLELKKQSIDLTVMAGKISSELLSDEMDREIQFDIAPGLLATGDPVLVEILMDNLISNAWKYSQKVLNAKVEIGSQQQMGNTVFYIRDNGAGFDMKYANQLFKPFNRLHSAEEFDGTGIGLATVSRIIERHHGKIWVKSAPNKGTTFYFTLFPQSSNSAEPEIKPISHYKNN
jgi:signal transduction histidine kinase